MTKLFLTIAVLMACGRGAPVLRDAGPAVEGRVADDLDLAAATATAQAYMDAVIALDYAGMCATRTPEERAKLADLKGSCEQAMEAVMKGKPIELLGTLEATNARRTGTRIVVDLMHVGATKPAGVLYLEQRGERWLLVDIPDSPPARPHANLGPVEPLAASDPDVIAAMQAAHSYFEATVMRDYAGMCASFTTDSQQILVNTVGGCEKAMEVFTRGQPVIAFAEAKVQNPRRRDGVIAFDVVHPDIVHGPIFLTKQGERWLMIHVERPERF